MSEQKRRSLPKPSVLAAVLLMGLAVGILVLLGVGLLMSSLVIRGSVGMEQIRKGVPVALFLASLAGGLFAAKKLEGMPLVLSLIHIYLVFQSEGQQALQRGGAGEVNDRVGLASEVGGGDVDGIVPAGLIDVKPGDYCDLWVGGADALHHPAHVAVAAGNDDLMCHILSLIHI